MGNLLSLLNDKGPVPKVDFYVDFEKAEPSETEQEVFSRVNEVLKKAPELLQDLRDYKGAGEEIREAISHPTSDVHQERAWQKVCPLVLRLRSYYDYAQELETVLGDILSTICSPEMTALEHLEKQQAITKQLAEMLDFILTFDDLKMTNPAIQNDFSYYRRTLNRRKMEELSMGVAGAPEVSDDLANRMSLFYANPTPMLNTLSTATSRLITEGNPQVTMENATECLSTMASVCRVINENPVYYSRFKNESTVLFCLRVMVGVIILYDHVHPVGAFAKKAAIDMKASIKVIKEHPQSAEGLLNALKYNTKHFNDEATPKATKTLLSS